MKPSLQREFRAQRGFSLVELMVGGVLGLLVTIIILQVMAFAEAQKRTTTSGSDAQVNGALALYTLQRDVAMAGYGMSSTLRGIGCEMRAQLGSVNFTWTLAPVTITAGANGAPDSLSILASSANSFTVPTRVVVDHPPTAANFFVDATLGINEGDLMVAVPPTVDANNWCSVIQVTKDPSSGGGSGNGNGNGGGQGQNQVLHNSGNDGPWNQPGGHNIFPAAGYPSGSTLINLGAMVDRRYAVNAERLQLTVFNTRTGTSSTTELYPHVVNLQAFYGKDTDGDGVVDTYDKTTPTTNGGWLQVRSIRMAIVARSTQFEKDEVTAANLAWDVGTASTVAGSADCGTSKCVSLKVDGITDWKHYRYKIYDTVVPLRNLLWSA